ncbi:integrase [Nostocaceae cyanobacterium CENA357]|uniref:Integrase n=1 Tax=Atlanticothrix silvestris CENA357 TaxID=1725252 RepID=A0A8J7L6L7_9CYAN|nr:integrase [Atlanticothrix silvestris]MBH8555857.1 integrase [Atlanticothrix silvestris CENA357]
MKWTVEAVNERLKAGKVGVKVEQRGDRLSLRATLPPKPGSKKIIWHQQYLSLGIYANPAGLQRAEAEAKIVGGLLARDEFDWSRYLEQKEPTATCSYWVEKFKQEYFASNGDDPTKQQTWKRHYEACFNKLPVNENLTPEILIATATATPANTWTRRTMCQRLEQLAKLAGVKVDLKKYQGSYSSTKQIIRQLPSEEEIVAVRDAIAHPEWQWVFGAIACFGLRPHEAFFCEISSNYPHTCAIAEGKTGSRIAFPLPLEWIQEWRLWENKKPSRVNLEGITNKDLGNRIYKALKRYGVKFKTYDLRHSYAIRAATKYKVPIIVAAKWMGHSPTVHTNTYGKHLTEIDHLEIFERLNNSPPR